MQMMMFIYRFLIQESDQFVCLTLNYEHPYFCLYLNNTISDLLVQISTFGLTFLQLSYEHLI